MDLGPCLDETALPCRKLTADELDRVDREYADGILASVTPAVTPPG